MGSLPVCRSSPPVLARVGEDRQTGGSPTAPTDRLKVAAGPPAFARALERPALAQDGRDRPEKDQEVEHDRPALEVEKVEADQVVEVELGPA